MRLLIYTEDGFEASVESDAVPGKDDFIELFIEGAHRRFKVLDRLFLSGGDIDQRMAAHLRCREIAS